MKDKINMSSDLKSSINYLLDKNKELFIKLSGGQLGLGVMLVKQKVGEEILINNENSTIQNLVDRMRDGEFIVQPVLKQHVDLNLLAPYSVNTIRLQTVLKPDGSVMPFGALMRLGRKNNCVDNWAKGGVAVGIDMDTGRLKRYGFLKPEYGGKVLKHPDTLVPLENFLVPYFNEAIRIAVQLHQHLYRCHSVGWDIAITDSGPVFLEGNGLWEISLVQANHGGLKRILEDYFNKNSYR